jgi:hypothetical protein
MHKRHAASKIPNITACGYECTDQEYAKMRGRKAAMITCAHCLKAAEK